MSLGPPKDGRPYVASVKRVHRLSDRFPKAANVVQQEKHRDALKARLTAHTSSNTSGMSWLDALLYERLFCDKIVPSNPNDTTGVDRDGFWCPSESALEGLVDLLDHQEALRKRCILAVQRRNQVLERILSRTCFAARQFETRERDARRAMTAAPHASSDSLSPQSSFSMSPTAGRRLAPLTLQQLWPNDMTRQFLHRVSPNQTFDACRMPAPRPACTIASHQVLSDLLEELDDATDDVVAHVVAWRVHLNRPLPFVYQGHNVMLLIQNDLDTIVASMVSHLADHAGGQTSYTARDCSFYYMSRYSGGGQSVGGGTVGTTTGTVANPAVGTMSVPRRGAKQQPVDPSVAKTLSYSVARELEIQLKLAEEGTRLAVERGVHIPPLAGYRFPMDLHEGSSAPSIMLPPFVLHVRGDPGHIRKYLQCVGKPFLPLPLIVQAPRAWFRPELMPLIASDLEQARGALKAPRSESVFMSASVISGTSLVVPSMGTDMRHRVVCPKVPPPGSAYGPVVILDAQGLLTSGGLHYLLHRETQQRGLSVIDRTLRWLQDCYTQGRIILDESFGSVVEPYLQLVQRQQAELRLLRTNEEQQALREGRSPKKSAMVLRCRARSVADVVEDYGIDANLDRLVFVAYGDGAAVTSPTNTEENSSSNNNGVINADAVPSGTKAVGTTSSQQQLVVLQRRSVKRFGLRVLRSWLRMHMQRLHRNEMTLDILEKNATILLCRRYMTWCRVTQRRQLCRMRAEECRLLSEKRLLHRRFAAWKVTLLSRAVAKNFNQWLYRTAYFGWLFSAMKKRFDRVLTAQQDRLPWVAAINEYGTMVGRKRQYLTAVAALAQEHQPPQQAELQSYTTVRSNGTEEHQGDVDDVQQQLA